MRSGFIPGRTANRNGAGIMARELAILACTECKRRNYTTTRNKRTMTNRLEIKKFCSSERKRTLHRETK